MAYVNANRLRQITFYILLIFLGVFLFIELSEFLPALLGALTFYMLMRNSMDNLVRKRKWKKSLAAGLLMFVSFLIVLVPIGLLLTMLTSKVSYAVQNSSEVINAVNVFVSKLETKLNMEILSEGNINKISITLAESLPNIVGATFNSILSVIILYFMLYFMLVNSREMEYWLYEYVPLKDENTNLIGTELKSLVISNALAIPLVALLQGVVALIGYFICGVDDPWFWFVITCIAAMLPFVGAALAYVPIAILFFANSENWQGVFILVYGFGIVGTVDNVFRIMIQKKSGDVHPLITVFGVILGLNLFGFIGLVFGPILIALFLLLVRIYINEFVNRRTPIVMNSSNEAEQPATQNQ